MANEKNGRVKVTIEVDVNEPLMDVMKESMKNMPEMAKMISESRGKKE